MAGCLYVIMKERKKYMGTKIVYNHKSIEKKWREKWEEKPVNPRVDENGNKNRNITAWICFRIRQEMVCM